MTLLVKLAAASVVGFLLAAGYARMTRAAPADLPADAFSGALGSWTNADFVELAAIADRIGANPADLLLVMSSESGLEPWAKNPLGAVGLFQLTAAAEGAVGLTSTQRLDVPRWPVSAQLPLGERLFRSTPWFRAGKPFTHAGTLYGNLFAPGRLMARGDDAAAVLLDTSDDSPTDPRKRPYANNAAAFDPNGTGAITVGGLIEHLRLVAGRSLYRNALLRLRAATGRAYLPTLPKG